MISTESTNNPSLTNPIYLNMDRVLELFDMCIKNKHKDIICIINHQTIKFMFNNGYSIEKYEAFHTNDGMKDFQGYGYITLEDLYNKVKIIIENEAI